MRLFVDLWTDPLIIDKTPSWPLREQDALAHLMLPHPNFRERIGFVRQRLINAYPGGENMWNPGDLVVHFAGCWVNDKCSEYFNEFWGKKGNVTI
jgi:hypothetical protein